MPNTVPTPRGESFEGLLTLVHRLRSAPNEAALRFLLVNDTHELAAYRQAALWSAEDGLTALSGVLQPEANAPYVQWLSRASDFVSNSKVVSAASTPWLQLQSHELPDELAQNWNEWWPQYALWLPLPAAPGYCGNGGLWLVREAPWSEDEAAMLAEWAAIAWHTYALLRRPKLGRLKTWRKNLGKLFRLQPELRWWQQTSWRFAAMAVLVLLFPVRITVLAPGELVPTHPVQIRAPLEGVIDTFHVQPNQLVNKDAPLFSFDEALIKSKLEVTRQSLQTAQAEYRQTAQQALGDAKYKTQLALLAGRIAEKQVELDFVTEQFHRAQVLSPQSGIAMFDDPGEWVGKPVVVGERIMRIAAEGDAEVEAWLTLSDAIRLEPGNRVTLYLHASPLSPVSAQIRYVAHDAVQRPDGNFAYRIRAKLDESTVHRIGLKGTAKLHGQWAPFAYWVLRRPLATLRSTIGW